MPHDLTDARDMYIDPTRQEVLDARQVSDGLSDVQQHAMQGVALAQFCNEFRAGLDAGQFTHEEAVRLLCAALSGR